MSHTVGRHRPRSEPRGSFTATCDDCGVRYWRSRLMRRPSGLLHCSGPGTNDCARGREVQTLDEQNAAAFAAISKTPAMDPAGFDRPYGLILDHLPDAKGFWCAGERVRTAYEDTYLLDVRPITAVVEGVPTYGTAASIPHKDNNILDTGELRDACTIYAGAVSKLYDQSGNGNDLSASENLPLIWFGGYRRMYTGFGSNPAIRFESTSQRLSRTDSCGISGDSAVTLYALGSGLGWLGSIGGTDSLSCAALGIEDEDSTDDHGEVQASFDDGGGYTLDYEDKRLHTIYGRDTTLWSVSLRIDQGSYVGTTRVLRDGQELEYTQSEPDLRTAINLTDVATHMGYSAAVNAGFVGHIYAMGLWDMALTDAQLELLETWGQDPVARGNDHRGYLVGSMQP